MTTLKRATAPERTPHPSPPRIPPASGSAQLLLAAPAPGNPLPTPAGSGSRAAHTPHATPSGGRGEQGADRGTDPPENDRRRASARPSRATAPHRRKEPNPP
ncbi:hypothetical protein TPA0909_28830 [Streptomyces albus]|nr:hypothetical protein TPA0909_28830 [Streptomyces albus]